MQPDRATREKYAKILASDELLAWHSMNNHEVCGIYQQLPVTLSISCSISFFSKEPSTR